MFGAMRRHSTFMSMKPIRLAGIVLTAAALSACGTTPAAQTGTVVGILTISPPMGADYPTGGTVTIAKQGAPHTSVIVSVGASGHFQAQVPPGTWVVTGRTPKYGDNKYVCRLLNSDTNAVNVAVGHQVSVTVWCPER
jgi:hypothetical protein